MKADDLDSSDGATEAIGARLRRRRKALHLTLKDVGARTSLGESFISQLERGVHTGSIRTLQKLSAALGLSPGELFAGESTPTAKVQRFDLGAAYDFGVDARKLRVSPSHFDHLESFLGVFEPYGSTGDEPYSHGQSEEMILVLEGTVEVAVGDSVHRLERFDSIPFSSSLPHRVAEVAGQRATVLWVMAPPSF